MLSMPPQGKPPQGIIQNANDSLMSYDDESSNCKLCLNNKIDTVCIPCGHRTMC